MTQTLTKLTIVILAGILSGGVVVADEKDTKGKDARTEQQAKDIFYRPPASAPSQPAPLALRYQILLRRGDYVSFVPDGFQFVSGDQFRVIFQSNGDGFAYIFNRGSSGQGHVLFPDPQINGGQNHIPAYTDYVVPAAGWYEFDRLPGVEELLVFFSPKPLAQLDGLAASGTIEQRVWQQVVTTMVETHAGKDIVYVEEGQTVVPATPPAQWVQPATPAPPPDSPSAQTPVQTPVQTPQQPQPQPNYCPATYVGNVGPSPNPLLIHTIKLRHN